MTLVGNDCLSSGDDSGLVDVPEFVEVVYGDILEEFDGSGYTSEEVVDEDGILLVLVRLADLLVAGSDVSTIVVELADGEVVDLSLHDFKHGLVLLLPVDN